jgi:hypothetical protein
MREKFRAHGASDTEIEILVGLAEDGLTEVLTRTSE